MVLLYMDMAAILVIWPGLFVYTLVTPSYTVDASHKISSKEYLHISFKTYMCRQTQVYIRCGLKGK